MADPICPGDSEPQPSAPLIYYATEADYQAAWGDWWRLFRPWFGLNPEFPHSVAELCANPPIGPFEVEPLDLLAAIRGDKIEWFNVFQVIQERLRWHLWNTYCQCAAATLPPGAECYDGMAAQLNAWMYHKLNEPSGTTATDYGSVGQDGTYDGAVTLAQAAPWADRVAARFTTGAEQGAVEVRGHDTTGIGRVSLSAWVYPVNYHTSPSNLQVIQTWQSGTASGALGMQLRIQASNSTTGTLRGFQYRVGGLTTELTGPSIPLNTWTHVVFTYDVSGFIHLAVNGVRSWTVSANQGSTGPHDAGAFYDVSQSSDAWFDGRTYGAMVTPPLTAQQEADLYAAGISSCEVEEEAGPVEEPVVPDVPPELPLPPIADCDEEDLCATLDRLRLDLVYVRNQLDVVQRQAAPFGYRADEVVVLSSSGTRDVRSLLGIAIEVTTVPAWKARKGSAVMDYMDLGWIAIGTADGWEERRILRHDEQWIPTAGHITRVGYDLAPGVAATLRTFRRLP